MVLLATTTGITSQGQLTWDSLSWGRLLSGKFRIPRDSSHKVFCSPKDTAAVVPSGERSILLAAICNSFAYNTLTAQGWFYQLLNTSFVCIWRLQCSHANRETVTVLHTYVFSLIRINPLFILAIYATLKGVILKGKEICKVEDEQLLLPSCLFWANEACSALLPSVQRPLSLFWWKQGHDGARGTGHGSCSHISSQFLRIVGENISDCSKGKCRMPSQNRKKLAVPWLKSLACIANCRK